MVSVLTTGRKGLDPRKGIAPLDPIDARHRALTSGGSVSRALEADGREFTGDRDAALGLLQALQEKPHVMAAVHRQRQSRRDFKSRDQFVAPVNITRRN